MTRISSAVYVTLITFILIVGYPYLNNIDRLLRRRSRNLSTNIIAKFDDSFEFGLATAPAHVEDDLNDSWVDWGRKGKIPFFLDQSQPTARLRFWSNPEEEIRLAASTGVKIFRLGIDWGRLVPVQPGKRECLPDGTSYSGYKNSKPKYPCRSGIQNFAAMRRYIDILGLVRFYRMRPMLTLFHHSLPLWANEKSFAGWTNSSIIPLFLSFVEDVVKNVDHLVDMYVVFNEPAVFANLVYAVNMWPGRLSNKLDPGALLNFGALKGNLVKCYENMAIAHNLAYDIIKRIDKTVADICCHNCSKDIYGSSLILVAQNLAEYAAYNPKLITKPLAYLVHRLMNVKFLDLIRHKLDIIGVNYYGTEFVSLTGAAILKHVEYSESGRAISPAGLYDILKLINNRYNIDMNRTLPILITENGISDSTDVLRPSYLIEHLMVLHKVISENIPVRGYIFWTISDNFEWADGYCPKFGIFHVNRTSKILERTPRETYFLFKEIVKNKKITLNQRMNSWNKVVKNDGMRPFCRSKDGKSTVRKLEYRKFALADWRFNYKLEMFQKSY